MDFLVLFDKSTHFPSWSHSVTPFPYCIPPMALLVFLQSAAAPIASEWQAVGASGLAGIMFYFYRQDRQRSEDVARKSEERIEKLTEDFREIVQENSRIVATFTEQMRKEH